MKKEDALTLLQGWTREMFKICDDLQSDLKEEEETKEPEIVQHLQASHSASTSPTQKKDSLKVNNLEIHIIEYNNLILLDHC